MKTLRPVVLTSALLVALCGVVLAQNSTAPSDLTRALVQAKTIYLVSGHVKYYKTKGFKTRLVEDSPFEEPSHKELEQWGRFQVVDDAKNADLLIRIYETSTAHPIPVGAVNTGGDCGYDFGRCTPCLKKDFVVHHQERWTELEHENSGGRAVQKSAGICRKPTERGSRCDVGNASERTPAGGFEIGTALMR